MKRVTLEIDLKENEIFEKEVEKVIRAKTREIIRGEYDRIIQDEASKEVKRLFDADSYGYRGKLQDLVKNTAVRDIRMAIEKEDIVGLTKETINEVIEYKIKYYSDIVDSRCKEVLEKTITKAVEEKMKSLLNKTDI